MAGIDTALDTVLLLTAAGQSVEAAVESSRVLTKQSVREHLNEKLANKNAAGITNTLATQEGEAASVPVQRKQPEPTA